MSSEPPRDGGSTALRTAFLLAASIAAACTGYGTVEEVPLADDLITRRDRFFDVATVDGVQVVVVGYGGKVLRSEDGGEHWVRATAPNDKSLLRVKFADAANGWVVGQDGAVLRTRDGGAHWDALASGIDSHLFGLAVRSADEVFACGDRSRWLHTRDGGATWNSGTVPVSRVGVNRDIEYAVAEPIYYDAALVGDAVWIVGDYGNIRVTTDGGGTWDSAHQSLLGQTLPGFMRPLRDALDLPALFRVAFRDPDHGWSTGVAGTLLETRDGGRVWRIVDPGMTPRLTAPLLEIALVGDQTLVFGGGAVALGTRAGARGWRRIDLGLPLLTWLDGAAFAVEGSLAGRRGFVVGGLGSILRTDDAGEHWRPVGFLPPRG